MKALWITVSRLLLTSIIIFLLTITFSFETSEGLAQTNTQSGVVEQAVTDYIWVSIRKVMVLSEVGNTSMVVDQTVAPTRLEIVYTEPMGQRTHGIIKASSVFGYSTNQGYGPGPITTGGAWMMRWVVTGTISLSDCSVSLKIYEYFIPGLEVVCGPIIGCDIGATHRESKGYYLIDFGSYEGLGYANLTLPPILPGSNSRIEAIIKMDRVINIDSTQLSPTAFGALWVPPCGGLGYNLLQPILPRLHVLPPHMDK